MCVCSVHVFVCAYMYACAYGNQRSISVAFIIIVYFYFDTLSPLIQLS